MSYFNKTNIQFADSGSVDAFGRLRVGNPVTQFDNKSTYTMSLLYWWQTFAGAGAATHVPNSSGVQLSTGDGNSGSLAYRVTKQYFRYQPGHSTLVSITGVMGALKVNVRQRVGLFDTNNGLFFEQDGVNLKVVTRTNTSGTPTDVPVNQSAWNLDRLNGAGGNVNPSGITLDTSKAQIFVIDLQWLGVGRVRFGFNIGGVVVYCHQFLNANTTLILPYMTSATLPCQWQIENTGAAGSLTTLLAICTSVISEGGMELERATPFTANNGLTALSVSTRRAILSIRPAATLNSIVNRTWILPDNFGALTKSQDILVELVYNPTFTTAGGALTWTTVDSANSGVEYCVHGDANNGAITNGIAIDSFYVPAGAGTTRGVLEGPPIIGKLPLVLDPAGANPIALSIVATALTSTATVTGHIEWGELH